MPENRVIMLVGPTAVGKTGTSILLAHDLATEIISADSMQIYRKMDIGTEKPTPAQLAAAPHHMIDIADPTGEFSAGRYLEMVRPIIEDLHARERIPLVVGGTGLYVKAMTRGLFDGPAADWALREQLRKESPETLHARLRELDPEAASAIEPGNTRRVIRTLEICIKTGRPASDLRREGTSPLPYTFIKIALTRQREELYRMIDSRVDEMMQRGLLREVRHILEMNPTRTPMQAIGYKELAAHLRGDYPLDEALRLIKRNTRRYSKRQMTWFRSEPGLHWVDATGLGEPEAVYERLKPILRAEGIDHIG